MRLLFSMPMCLACAERRTQLEAAGIPYEVRPLADLERGAIDARELDRMGLIATWADRQMRGEPHLIAPTEIEQSADGRCVLVREG